MAEKYFLDNNFEEKLNIAKRNHQKSFITRIIIVGILFLILSLYLLTPLSWVGNYSLKGNLNLSKENVLEICHLNKNDSLYLLDEKKAEELLENHPLIKSCEIKNSIFGLKIEIEELTPVLKTFDGDYYFNDASLKTDSFLQNESIPLEIKEIGNSLAVLTECDSLFLITAVKKYSNIYFNISPKYRQEIKYFRVIDSNKYSFFYNFDGYYQEIVIPFNNSITNEDIAYALDEESISRYLNGIFEDKESTLVKQNYQINQTSFEYYSILVKIEKEFNTGNVRYTAYANNGESNSNDN